MEQRDFVHKVLNMDHKLVYDFFMHKIGMLSFSFIRLDASHTGMMIVPSVETFSVALKDSSVQPYPRSSFAFLNSC